MPTRRIFLALALAAACGDRSLDHDPSAGYEGPPRQIVVAAAMSLKEAMLELEQNFEKDRRDVDVVFNFAGSQILATQIVEGAPADVFASADHAQISRAARSGRLGPARVFARNRLVIITPVDVAEVASPADLARPNLRLVLAGEGVPAGVYAREALAKLGIREAALANVVSNEENVRGVVGKVAAGEADAGIVYATDVTPAVAAQLRTLPLTGAEDVVPTYEVAVVTDSKHPDLAAAFADALAGEPGAGALTRRGFLPP